jgi:hypothetical protein
MTPAEFAAQVHAAGPNQGHPFTPDDRAVDERYAAELDAARPVRCVAHAGRCIIHDRPVDTGRPFDGCGL